MIAQRYVYHAQIINVVDGDTVDANVDLGFNIFFKVRLRLNGINTAELKDADATKRAAGNRAKERVTELLKGRNVVIESRKIDKYGRYLADIYLDSVNINQQLITEGLAVPYMV